MKRTRSAAGEPRRRTGGRSARVLAQVLDATLDALAHGGYAALSFEGVATRAGVSRTTLYRRWPSKHDLVRAALLRISEAQLSTVRDTGSLRGDLLEYVRAHFLDRRERERFVRLFRALTPEFDDPELLALVRLARGHFEQQLAAAVERAVARGELPAGTEPKLVFEPITSTLFFRVAVFGEEADQASSARLVDLVLAGARAGAAVRPAPR